MNVRTRLIVMNFLEYAVWGAYLTSLGTYLAKAGLAEDIGIFYAMQGIVSLFMPALVGIVADRWIPAQKMLGICHALAAVFMLGASYYGFLAGPDLSFATVFPLYSLSVAFFMPTIALSNSVAYTVLEMRGFDRVAAFPPIRVFGTIGFICAMLVVNFAGFQDNYRQLALSGGLGVALALYAFTLPGCPVDPTAKKSLVDTLGLNAFKLFRNRDMAIFFIFSMLLGVALQITNAYANPFITSFQDIPMYAGTFGANNANALISISQVSETLGILLIPFFLKRYGIKNVMLMSMAAWVLRFGLFGLGNPGFPGVILFILSMVVYGVAFDFFNISGSLFVDSRISDKNIRSSAQGLFMIMTNGVGATLGTLAAQAVVNHFVYSRTAPQAVVEGWNISWFIFAGYALVVGIVFALVFRYKHEPGKAPVPKV